MERVSTFSRTVDNFANKGQYFTCPFHSKAIGKLLEWPENEVSIIEPSIGDASALFSFLDKKENRTVFGVELDKAIYEDHKKSKKVDYILNADFLSGISISNHVFSLAFANPPYGDSEYNERYESIFMKRLYNYIKTKGILVLIIPYYLFEKDSNFAVKFTNRFDVEAVYKFHEKEFKKFKQVVLIGRRKSVLKENPQAAEALKNKVLDIENLELLPMDYKGKKIQVYPSSSEAVNVFQTMAINKEEMCMSYKRGGLLGKANILKKVASGQVLTPPIPPKSGHLYLLGTIGFQSGIIGSEADKDLHLQRGKVREEVIVETEPGNQSILIERKKTIKTTSMVIVQSDGRIIRF